MTKKKNMIEKFRNWYTKLSYAEQAELYDVLSLLRGPDVDDNDEKIKTAVTGRIRKLIGISIQTASRSRFGPIINHESFPSIGEILEQIYRYREGHSEREHYSSHAEEAVKILHKLGIIKCEKECQLESTN